MNITDELLGGGLSTLLLRMWFERDENDRRRVPIMLHRLKVRVSDSLHPLKGAKAVFRIEVSRRSSFFAYMRICYTFSDSTFISCELLLLYLLPFSNARF